MIDRMPVFDGEMELSKSLSEDQSRALEETKAHFETQEVVLLHGVT